MIIVAGRQGFGRAARRRSLECTRIIVPAVELRHFLDVTRQASCLHKRRPAVVVAGAAAAASGHSWPTKVKLI